MSMSTRPFIIVCAVDLSDISPVVIEHALAEANRHPSVHVHFLTIVETRKGRFSREERSDAELAHADSEMRRLVRELLPAFSSPQTGSGRKIRFHTRSGQAGDQILELALEARADRLVVGRHNSAAHRKMPGGISAAVVNEAPCTVEIVQVADYERMQEDYEQCTACVAVRAESAGGSWFCTEHDEGRVPRLSSAVGRTSNTPGWGIF